MSGMGAILAQMLPPDAPQEVRDAVLSHGDAVPLDWLAQLMGDAQAAKEKLDAGDRAGAELILTTWKDRADQLGLGPMYDQMIGSLFPPTTDA